MKLPTSEQIAQLGEDFDFEFPRSYTHFIERPVEGTVSALRTRFPDGWWLTSRDELGSIFEIVGDFLKPFFVCGTPEAISSVLATDFEIPAGLHLYCFDLACNPIDGEYEVSVFSIHTTVAQWPDFTNWLAWIESGARWKEWLDQGHRPRSWDE